MRGKEKMLTVRLDEQTEKQLKQYASDHDMSKTMIVQEALAQYFSGSKNNPFELGSDLFGADASGQSDLSATYKSKLKEKLSGKHAH